MPSQSSATSARTCQLARPTAAAPLFACGALVIILAAENALGRSKLQAVGQVTLGYTDNAQSTPDEPVRASGPSGEVLVPGKSGDAFATLSPGVVYGIEIPGALHRFSYTYTISLFFEHSEANSYSNRLEWRAFLEPLPRLDLVLGASATQSHHHTQGTLAQTSQTAFTAALPGTGAFVLATADEGLSYSLSPEWSAHQGTGLALQVPVFEADGPRSYQVSQRLGLERTWLSDAVGAEARATYVVYNGPALAGASTDGNQSQLINAYVGTWRHDYNEDFASRVEAGATQVVLFSHNRQFWHPTGLFSLGYLRETGEAELSYRHAVTTSIFLGQSFLIDEVRLRGSLPLTKKAEFVLAAAGTYQHARVIDVEGELATELDLVGFDVALAWQTLDELELAVRYQHLEQASDASLPPLPLSYVRNTAMVIATLEFPSDREMPQRYRESRRVDRADALDTPLDEQNESTPNSTTGR